MKQNGIVNNGKSSGRKSRYITMQQMMQRVVAIMVLAFVCGEVWGQQNKDYYYSATANVSSNCTGMGTASVDPESSSTKSKSAPTVKVTFKATPNDNYEFLGWSTTNNGTTYESTNAIYEASFTVTSTNRFNRTNKTLYANFKLKPQYQFSVLAHAGTGGSVSPADTKTYTASTSTTTTTDNFTAIASDGYEFVNWTKGSATGDVVSTDAMTKFQITSSSTTVGSPTLNEFYANFRELPLVYFKATAVAVPTGGGTVSASVIDVSKRASSSTNPSATTSATYTVTSTADGYYFIGWSDTEGGEIKSTATSYTKTITATSTSSSSPTETKAYANFKAEPTGIAVSPTSMELGAGGTKKITVTLSPSGAYENITYSSDKPGVATVAADGTVTGVAAGTATITVQAKTSGGSAPESLRKTVSVTVKEQVAMPVISFTPIDDGATATATITCATEGAVIYYTINSDDPTPPTSAKKKDTKTLTSPQGTTKYENPFTVDANDVVRAIAIKDDPNYINSLVATLMYSPKKVPTPTINMAKGQVTFSCEEPGVTFYYTTDGTTTPTAAETATCFKWEAGDSPVTGVNEKNIQVIAVKSGFSNSAVASKLYIAGSGVSGTTVILNDYEDHTWTYYSDKPDTDYPDVLRSPDPRNVKIVYTGGAVSGASAVAVSATESQNTFIYYETIEKNAWGSDKGRWLTGDYAYRTIRNPFSKRPKNGTTYYGFNGWKIISGGKYIGKTDGTTVAADELVNFQNFSSTDPNATAAVIEFEAQWAVAEMKTSENGTMPSFTKDSYELNLWVITGNSSVTVSAPSKPVTVMGCYPDGSSAGTATIGSATSGTNVANILKIENIKIGNGTASVHPYEPNTPGITNDAGSGTFTVQNGALIVGRGCVGTVATVQSGNSGRQYYLCMESGKYRYVNPMSSGSNNEDGWGRIVFGCDYDRASDDGHDNNGTGDNSKLRVVSYISWSSNGTGKASGSTSEWMDITVKSGYFGYCHNTTTYSTSKPEGRGLAIGGNSDNAIEYKTLDVDNQTYFTLTQNDLRGSTVADKTNSLYCGGSRSYAKGGVIRVLIEGGELNSINGGSYNNASKGVMAANFRVKGGWIKGALYGTASSSVTDANTRIVVTGGEINGWIAGACNGTDFQGGSWVKGNNNGSTYLYIGGNAECRSHNKDGKYNNAWGLIGGVQGGNIFASGRGGNPADFGAAVGSTNYNACSYCGSSIDTYLVVADKCQVEQAVYGGGYLGIAQQSHIWITGGTIGAVYGGASAPITTNTDWRAKSTDIRMYGGLVKNGVYGGHYLGSDNAGAIHGNSSVAIYGGQVGTDVTHTGNVYGGGMGDGTKVNENVTVTLGQLDSEGEPVKGVLKIFGNVYGGSALGQTNTTAGKATTVTVNSGIVSGNVFGGGMGELSGTGRSATPVTGHGTVNGTISVTVNGTDETGTGYSGLGKYAIGGVFGGCDMVTYNGTPTVTINNCESSIRYVYGGGNASDVEGTNVTINAGDIDYAFGGGNGADTTKPGANINGDAELNIFGGTINNIFGGSNTLGDVTGTATVTLNDGNDECPITAQEVYGGANEAPMTGTPQLNLVCLKNRLEKVYGGSRAVDVAEDVVLNITGGEYGQVFGGNNVSGNIKGSITVNIDETGCSPIKIDELYCGGDKAHYSVYGYNTDGTPKTSGDKYDDPTINVISCTRIGKVFGGGYGNSAVVYGDPHVNINLINGAHSASVTNRWNNKLGTIGDVYGGGNAAKVVGDTYVNIGTKSTVLRADGTTNATVLGVNISGNVYGGGNAADVTGKTNVTVGK